MEENKNRNIRMGVNKGSKQTHKGRIEGFKSDTAFSVLSDKLDMVRTLFKIQKSFQNVSVVFSKSTRSLTRASFLTYFFSCLYEDYSVYNSPKQ